MQEDAAAQPHEEAESADSKQGPPMTPPQPAPSDSAAATGPEAEMSFTDLIDDSDEEQGARSGAHNLATVVLAEGQVVVDAEDVDVRLLQPLYAILALQCILKCMQSMAM